VCDVGTVFSSGNGAKADCWRNRRGEWQNCTAKWVVHSVGTDDKIMLGMRTSLFWDVMQHVLVVHTRFDTVCQSVLQESSSPRKRVLWLLWT
jgi:hypothetical protein